MSYSLLATLSAHLDVREQADSTTSPSSTSGGNQRSYNQYSLDASLNSTSFPPIAGRAIDLSGTLSGTTKDFDLTAAPWAGDLTQSIDKSTFKLIAIIIQTAKANNAAGLTFGPQGVNGYGLFGAAKTLTLFPGAQHILFYADPLQVSLTLSTPAVGAGAKDLRFTGTAADVWKCLAIFNG